MEKLKEIAYCLCILSVSSGISSLFTVNSKLKKYVEYLISLLVIISLALVFGNVDNSVLADFYSVLPDDTQQKNIEENHFGTIEYVIRKNISEQFDIKPTDIAVSAEMTQKDENTILNKVNISLSNSKDFEKKSKIEYYVNNTLSLECEIKTVEKKDERHIEKTTLQ